MDFLDQFHPFIAHFPIAYSSLVILFAIWVFFKKEHIGYLCLMFILTFITIVAAQISGSYEVLGKLTPELQTLVNEHKMWSIFSFWVALVGCFISMIAWMTYLRGHTIWERLFILLTLAFALGTVWTVYETTTRGDTLVFEYGVGVKAVGTNAIEWTSTK